METKIQRIDRNTLCAEDVKEAAICLQRGASFLFELVFGRLEYIRLALRRRTDDKRSGKVYPAGGRIGIRQTKLQSVKSRLCDIPARLMDRGERRRRHRGERQIVHARQEHIPGDPHTKIRQLLKGPGGNMVA